ncbi:MAG: hypothetical protein OEW75_05015 [Cyclobacteriaceae bacterium]|nr:hypothetical protein [Cyclobacteriaceae bacterium]
MLQTVVKIDRIQNLSDARYCSAMGVEYLGFSIDSNTIDESFLFFKSISEWVAGVQFVLEVSCFEESIASEPVEIIESTNKEVLSQYMQKGKKTILSIPLLKAVKSQNHGLYSYIKLTEIEPHMFQDYRDELIEISRHTEIWVEVTNINSDQVVDITKIDYIKGITISGGTEPKPGFKDYDELSEIFEALEDLNE